MTEFTILNVFALDQEFIYFSQFLIFSHIWAVERARFIYAIFSLKMILNILQQQSQELGFCRFVFVT